MDNSTKIITISKIEMTSYATGNQYKLTTTENQKFKFYDKKKDGTSTVAYDQFQDMEIQIGSTVEVWYKEIKKDYEGKPYTDRIIASFREAVGKPTTSTPKTPLKPNLSEPAYVQEKDDTFWDKKALKQCIWGYWLERKSTSIPTQEEMTLVANTFDVIEKFTEARSAKGWNRAVAVYGADEPLPEETIDVSQIPF